MSKRPPSVLNYKENTLSAVILDVKARELIHFDPDTFKDPRANGKEIDLSSKAEGSELTARSGDPIV